MLPLAIITETEKITMLAYELLYKLEEYLKSDVYIAGKNKIYLSNFKDMLKRIESRNKEQPTALQLITISKLMNNKYKELANYKRGEKIPLTTEDSKFIFVTDTIISIFEDILDKKSEKVEKSLIHQVKIVIGLWYGYEKYILKGAR